MPCCIVGIPSCCSVVVAWGAWPGHLLVGILRKCQRRHCILAIRAIGLRIMCWVVLGEVWRCVGHGPLLLMVARPQVVTIFGRGSVCHVAPCLAVAISSVAPCSLVGSTSKYLSVRLTRLLPLRISQRCIGERSPTCVVTFVPVFGICIEFPARRYHLALAA